MTGPGTTISGTGVMADSRLYIDAPGIILSSGSTQNLTNDAQIRVGSNNTASFTLDGTITGTGQTVGNRLFRVYN